MKNIAIVGAGLAGLTVAKKLKNQANLTLFKKSRGVCGDWLVRGSVEGAFESGNALATTIVQKLKKED